MIVTIHNYYQPGWRDQQHTCDACDWQGTSRGMEMELHDEQTEYSCPQCECPVLVVQHPTLEDVKAAAAAGNEEAQQQLAILEMAPKG